MGYSYKAKIEGGEVALDLTDQEVQSAISVIEGSGVEEVHILKKGKGHGAMFYINEQNAIACQQRHKFDFMFTLKKSDLTDYWEKIKGKFVPKSESQEKK